MSAPSPIPVARSATVDLFLASVLLLFLELTLIRWVPAGVRIVAYFSNVLLVAVFLGVGVGCLYRKAGGFLFLTPWIVLLLAAVCRTLGEHGVANPSGVDEYFFRVGTDRVHWVVALPPIFIITAGTFIAIGRELAGLMDRLPPLRGYSVNIAGSLAGTLAFAAVSFAELPPSVWFLAAFAPLLALLRHDRRTLLAAVPAVAATLLLVRLDERPFSWSPYYKIEVSPLSDVPDLGYGLTVNGDYHQLILNLDPAVAARSKSLTGWARSYDFPFRFRPADGPFEVLVLGSGGGNDVAAALRAGATHVDAVELDPTIVALGRRLHPEKPYADPRVTVHVNDARAYLSSCRRSYDLIVLGWLDSHRIFSSLSNVRQDNFVYTVEAMRRARHLLRDEGVLTLCFHVGKPWLGRKIGLMLEEAFDRPPRIYALEEGGYGPLGAIFVSGRDGEPRSITLPAGSIEQTATYAREPSVEPPRDDWPYLYYRDRRISREYLQVVFVLAAIGIVMVLPSLRGAPLPGRDAAHFFFLGAAFLLLEVRNIATLALALGSTWLVTSLVIAAILGCILVANGLVSLGVGLERRAFLWVLLFASVAASLLWSRAGTMDVGHTARVLTTMAIVSSTFLFAGVVFARSFGETAHPGAALGFNVIGAVVGGLLEYASLRVGIQGLSLLALALYGLAAASAPVRPVPQS